MTMLNVQLLSERYNLTPKQVRDRLTALSPIIDRYIVSGKQNAKLLTDEGLAIFDRLIQLEREGIAMTTAVELISKDGFSQPSDTVNRVGTDGLTAEYIAELKERIASLERDKTYLQEQLARALAQVEELQRRALPPPPRRRWWWPWSGRG
jgi:hypothetical protein